MDATAKELLEERKMALGFWEKAYRLSMHIVLDTLICF